MQKNWIKKAEYRKENRGWLKYAYKISLRIQAAIEEKENFSQKDLAKLIGVSPQYISKVIKGQENLTLETIFKLSSNLGVELVSFPDFKYTLPISNRYINSKLSKSFSTIIISGIVDEQKANLKEHYTVYDNKYELV